MAEVVNNGPMKTNYDLAYYLLGSPRLNSEGEVVYWLNGTPVKFTNGRSYQPMGWCTLDDLVEERYAVEGLNM